MRLATWDGPMRAAKVTAPTDEKPNSSKSGTTCAEMAEKTRPFSAMTVAKAGYPDPTAFDSKDSHYDPDSDPAEPTWFVVDVEFAQKFAKPVTRDMLKSAAGLEKMMVIQKGSRLSIQPVTPDEWRIVHQLAGAKPC